jgi:hypothetical protein
LIFSTPLKQTHRKDRTRADKACAGRLQRLFAGLELEPGAVVIASLPDSYRIPALVDLGVVAIDRNHASPAVSIEEREEDLALLLAGDLEARASLVEKHAARYVLTSSPEPEERFAGQRLMREPDGYRLYEIVRAQTAEPGRAARR